MRRLGSALLLAALAGCASDGPAVSGGPAAPPSDAFDADVWLARARAASGGPEAGLDDRRLDAARALSAELDAAVGWSAACDRSWDPERGEMVADDAGAGWARGTFSVHDVPGGAVVAVTCDFGAYQGTYALVSLFDGQAALLAGQGVDLEGAPFGPPAAVYATPAFDGSARFQTFGRARGLGDCGIFSTYEIAGPDAATLVEARARDCEGDPDLAGPPEGWPIVYRR